MNREEKGKDEKGREEKEREEMVKIYSTTSMDRKQKTTTGKSLGE